MSIHALIIDDNRANVEVMQLMLEQNGIAYTSLMSLRNLEATLTTLPAAELVFLDLEFPNGSGFDVFQMLRAAPALSAAKIIAYSVHISEIDRARRMGFDGFLGKPLDRARFQDQLMRIVRGEGVWDI